MRKFWDLSIRYKQTLVILLTSMAALVLACSAFVAYDVVMFRKALAVKVGSLAEVLSHNLTAALDFGDPDAARQILGGLRFEKHIIRARVYDREGELFAEYRLPGAGEFTSPPLDLLSERFEGNLLHVFRPIEIREQAVGTIYLASDLEELPARLRDYVTIAALVFAGALLAAMALSSRLQRLVSAPILDLARMAHTVAQDKNYALRARRRGADELGQLVDRFNEMLNEIQRRDHALEAARAELEERVKERTRELANSLSLLTATLESTADGVLVVDQNGRVTSWNTKFLEMWGISRDLAMSRNDDQLLAAVVAQVKDADAFLLKVQELYATPEAVSQDVVEFKDGRLFERYSQPQRQGDRSIGRVWCFRDVTERRRAEETLRRTEELYRRAIAGVGAVPYSYDFITRTYAFIGEGIERLIGYGPHEITPELWGRIVQESVMLGEAAGLDKAEASRRVKDGKLREWRCDMRVLTRSGQSRWISDASVQHLDAAGRPVGSMGILEDITERKQTEMTARAFSKLGQELNSATSPEGAASIIGEVSEKLFGWDAFWVKLYDGQKDIVHSLLALDTVDGRRVRESDRVSGPPSALHRRILVSGAELILRQRPGDFLAGARPFGNKARPSASLMLAPVRYRSRIVGMLSVQSYTPQAYTERDLATLQDLADQCGGALERIQADEARRQSESQFRLVWNASEDGMRLIDRAGTIVMVNDAFCRIVGKARPELEGQPLSVVYSPEEAGDILRLTRERLACNAIEPYVETQVTLWNGAKVWFELSNAPLEVPGRPPLLLSIFRDASERKQAEAELERMHRELLETSRQAGMAEVATNVLHNVGNVLNSVNTSAGVIVESLRTSKVSGVARLAELLAGQTADLAGFLTRDGRAEQVIAYLQSLARQLETEQATLNAEVRDLQNNIEHIKEIVAMQQRHARSVGVLEIQPLADLVEDAVRLHAAALNKQGVRIERQFEDLPPVPLDRHKVLQILINLIRNAQQALLGGPAAEHVLTLQIQRPAPDRVRVVVADNGIGIEPGNLARIFSHGFTTRAGGHGFGLHGGWLAAREMGGALTVHSDGPGRGARFVLELPVQLPSRPA